MSRLGPARGIRAEIVRIFAEDFAAPMKAVVSSPAVRLGAISLTAGGVEEPIGTTPWGARTYDLPVLSPGTCVVADRHAVSAIPITVLSRLR
jgi:hypothetical protein